MKKDDEDEDNDDLDDEAEGDEDDDDEDDDDRDDEEIEQGELLEEIDDALSASLGLYVESDVKKADGIIELELDDNSRWQLRLTRIS